MRRATRTATLFTIFALASAMAACSKKDEKPAGATGEAGKASEAADPATGMKPGSCDHRTDTGVCTFSKESSADMCKAMSGTPIDGPCPADGVLGTCASPDSLTGEVKSYYPTSAAKYTVATAKAACEAQQGVWTAADGAAGAGAATAAATVGACTVKKEKSCSETKLNNPDDSATYAKQCAEISEGTWAEGPCPTEGVIGECNSAAAGRTVYYEGAEDPKHTCEQTVMGGVYTAAAK